MFPAPLLTANISAIKATRLLCIYPEQSACFRAYCRLQEHATPPEGHWQGHWVAQAAFEPDTALRALAPL